jgi:hypothetical protein
MADLYSAYGTQPKKDPNQTNALSLALSQGGTTPTDNPYQTSSAVSAPSSTGTVTSGLTGKQTTVMQGNGTIPPATTTPNGVPLSNQTAAAPAPAPVAAPAPAPVAPAPVAAPVAPATHDPNALPPGAKDFGNGLVQFADGQILPRNHPEYAAKAAKAFASAAPAAPVAAAGPAAPVSQAPTAYGAPQQTQDQIYGLMSNLLSNPYSMSDQTVSQMKEQGKEQAVGLADQLAHKLKQDAAARGVSFSGNEAMRGEKIGEAMNSDIIRGNRDVDLAKAQQDRQDLMGVLGMGADYTKQAQGNYFQNLDQGRQNASLALQDKLGTGSLNVDQSRLAEQSREANLSHSLALQQFLENQRQFNNQMGFNYNQLGQNGQLSQLNSLSSLF